LVICNQLTITIKLKKYKNYNTNKINSNMETKLEIFRENYCFIPSDIIIAKIKNGEWQFILNGLCNIENNSLIIDYNYFKYFASKDTYHLILKLITNNIDSILNTNELFSVYVNMKTLTISEIDKHRDFISHISGYLKEKYPNKLAKCYVYNAPFVFSTLFNIICLFIDKETQSKIELVNK